MKKITNFGVCALVITALFVGMSGFAQAASTSASDDYGTDASVSTTASESSDTAEISTLLNSSGLDVKTKTDIEASFKAGNARCAALATRDQKETCVKQNNSLIRAKLGALLKARGITGSATAVKDVSGIRGEPKAGAEKAIDGRATATTNDGMNSGKEFAAKFANTIARLEAYVERFTKLGDRIDARAKELSAKGMDVSVAAKLSASARNELDLAKISIQAAKDSFKIESAAATTIKDDSVKTEDKIVYSKAKFKICAAQSKVLTLTAPQRCEMNGITYVDEDRNTTSASSASETPTQGQGLLTSTEAKFQNITGAFTKTRANVKAASQHIIYATTYLMQANSSLTQTEANFRAKGSTGATTN